VTLVLNMKKAILVLFPIFLALALSSQPRPPQGLPSANTLCEDQAHALSSGAYVFSVFAHVRPPAFPVSRGIAVAVQLTSAQKLFLLSDGSKFQLWAGTARVPEEKVWSFLGNLADSCRLPADPADAVKLLNTRWESKELTRLQFEQLHNDFLTALSQYVSTVQERSNYFMATRFMGGGVDGSQYRIVYDNSWEHFEIEEWDLPINGQTRSMIQWVRQFQGVAEQSFQRTFGTKE
jgi:hypothetical protein